MPTTNPWRWTDQRIIELIREDSAPRPSVASHRVGASHAGPALREDGGGPLRLVRRALFVAGFTPAPTRRFSDEQIVGLIREWAAQHGEPPTSKDWEKAAPGRPCTHTVAGRFGSWSQAIRAAGFEPRRSPRGVLRTHCRRGHELAGENLGVDGRGIRFCRACKRARDRASTRRRRRAKPRKPSKRRSPKAKLYAARRAVGLCGRCGRSTPDDGYVTCGRCRAEMRARWRERYSP
jgi:hypothetical protein